MDGPPVKPRPFRLGTTSFIYPDHIIPNVRKTGRCFDEIELLVFESRPRDVLPGRDEIRELQELARDLDLAYNVHLPVDVSLTAASGRERRAAADTLKTVLDRFAPLSVSTFTLHLDMERHLPAGEKAWQDRAHHGLGLLAPVLEDPALISVETLWYDPMVLAPLIEDFGLSLCADAGHHFKYGYDLDRTFDRFGDRISIVHLHGVDTTGPSPRDHIGLERLSPDRFDRMMNCLSGFTGIVSLEVFNFSSLQSSLDCLRRKFTDIPVLEWADG